MIRTAFVALVFASAAVAADPVQSGIPVGKRPGPYSFLVATGPQRGQPTCYVCEQHEGGKPAAVVFARSLSDPLGKLLTKLDAAGAGKDATGYKVWMTQVTPTADLDGLAAWSQKQGLKGVPVGAFEGPDGPPAYRLNPDADVTVMLFVKTQVVANFAFRKGELTDKVVEQVVAATPQLFKK
ncbi:hypothetical protein [Urbifossiella limnaea]|uniref:Thioredoxin domain-containing protein n=1 Tax=Urbifossiella limnaea TaxID=2528023 RepID=A0A517XYH3_9BACT|nr:hypothetical protein [Urbifossiella limnaea]QDU22567.1 hypothetical protein ETAA1_45500 [Urbifossiella limnaea]